MRLSEDHNRAIGRVCVSFSDVEIWVQFFIGSLIGDDEHIGRMITAEMSFSRQLDLLASLFKHKNSDPTKIETLESFIRAFSEIEQRRNSVVHSAWSLPKGPEIATRLKITSKRKRGLHYAVEDMTPAEIERIADDFDKTLWDFTDFMMPDSS